MPHTKMVTECHGRMHLKELMLLKGIWPRMGFSTVIFQWKLMGSLDGKNWTNLRVHENDGTVCKPGQFASWSITGPNALLPFRYFRVVLTRPTVDATNPWNFCLCYLELYGYFHKKETLLLCYSSVMAIACHKYQTLTFMSLSLSCTLRLLSN